MNEIKYRAWNIAGKQMFQPVSIHFGDDASGKIISVWGKNKNGFDYSLVHGESCYLLQYTGLKDKNGKEIYKGDIVNITQNAGEFHAQIIWLDDQAQFRLFPTDGEDILFDDFMWLKRSGENEEILLEFEIIGNIYENPDLLSNNK